MNDPVAVPLWVACVIAFYLMLGVGAHAYGAYRALQSKDRREFAIFTGDAMLFASLVAYLVVLATT